MANNIKENLSEIEIEISKATELAMQNLIGIFNQVNTQLIETQKTVFQPILDRIDQYEKLRDQQFKDHFENQNKLIASLMESQALLLNTAGTSLPQVQAGAADSKSESPQKAKKNVTPAKSKTSDAASSTTKAKGSTKAATRKPLQKKTAPKTAAKSKQASEANQATAEATSKAATKTRKTPGRKPLAKNTTAQSDQQASATTTDAPSKAAPKPRKVAKPAGRKPLQKKSTGEQALQSSPDPQQKAKTKPTKKAVPIEDAKETGDIKPEATPAARPEDHKNFNKPLSEIGITPMIMARMQKVGLTVIGQLAFPSDEDKEKFAQFQSIEAFPLWISKAKQLLS
jgi:hypothetical protein